MNIDIPIDEVTSKREQIDRDSERRVNQINGNLYILFLCKANMFRSQIAEAWYNHLSRKNKAISAALISHEGELSWLVTKSSKEFGLDLKKQYSKEVTKKMLKEADIIIIMNENLKESFSKYKNIIKPSARIEIWNIPDIVAKETDKHLYPEFVKTCEIIGDKVKQLIKKYG